MKDFQFGRFLRKYRAEIAIGLFFWLAGLSNPAVGRFFLRVFALGSSYLVDLSYRSAALNPTPLPSYELLSLVPPVIVGLFFILLFKMRDIGKDLQQQLDEVIKLQDEVRESGPIAIKKQPPSIEKRLTALKKSTVKDLRIYRLMVAVAVAMYISVILYGMIGTVVIGQAIRIWRGFNADVAICAPYLKPGEEVVLRARFAAMRGRADYLKIQEELKAAAAKGNVRLVW